MPSSRGFSQPRVQTQVSSIAHRFFTIWVTREAHKKQIATGNYQFSQFSLSVVSKSAVCHASLSITNSQSFLKLMSIESVMPSNHLNLSHPLLLPSIFLSIRVFSNESVLCISGQSIGVSVSASVLPMNIQDWILLGWTSWISLQSKGLSRVFSNITVQKHQFFSAQLSLWSNSHIYTWLLEKPQI